MAEVWTERIESTDAPALGVVTRWGGILAGLFASLSLLVLLSEIGASIGLASYDPGDRAAPYAIGAGIWGLVSLVASFLAGGMVASYVSRLAHPTSGTLQGALVWAVAIPVIALLGAMLTLGAAQAAGTTAAAAAAAADDATTDATTGAATTEVARRASEATRPENVAAAANRAGAVGWAMVAGMLVSLGAAAMGGRLGARACERTLHTTKVAVREGPGPGRMAPLGG